jgi:hypothetical protein
MAIERLEVELPFGEPGEGLGRQDAPRRGELFHPGGEVRGLADRAVLHGEVVVDASEDDLARIQPDPDLRILVARPSPPLLLGADSLHHLQGGVPGPQRVVLVGERCTEQRHDAVTHDLVHGAFVGVNRFHHPLDDRVEDLAGLLGIAAGHELHRALHVGEEHRDLLAFALERGLGDEDLLGQMLKLLGSRPGRGLDERDGTDRRTCSGGFWAPHGQTATSGAAH